MKQFRDTPYYVTEDGQVFRHYPERYVKNGINNKTGKQQYLLRPEKWKPIPGWIDKDGYNIIETCTNAKKIPYKVHRMVAELYCKGYFDGAWVDHIDCNPSNNHYTNLQWCTKEYNGQKRDNLNYPLYSEWCK